MESDREPNDNIDIVTEAVETILSRALANPTHLQVKSHKRSASLSFLDTQTVVADSVSILTSLIMSTISEIQPFPLPTPDGLASKSVMTPSTSPSPKLNGSSPVAALKVDPNIKIEKAKSMLDLAMLEKEVYELATLLNEKVSIVESLQNVVDGEAEGLETNMATLKKEQVALEAALRRAEENKQNFVMAVAMDKGDVDRVNLRKAELEIMKLKALIVEKEIEIMEAEMTLKAHEEAKAKGTPELFVAQDEVDKLAEKLQKLKSTLEDMIGSHEIKFGEATDSVYAKLSLEIRVLKEKNESMIPLWYIGHATRNRYLEGEVKAFTGQHIPREVDARCFEGYKLGKAVADATMYLEFTNGRRGSVEEFKTIYGVEAGVVWEHRGFQSFINMLNWLADMHKFGRTNPAFKYDNFLQHYNQLFPKIYPGFEVNCDEQINNDEEMLSHYLAMQSDHDQARSNKNNTGNGPPRNASQPVRGFFTMNPRNGNRT